MNKIYLIFLTLLISLHGYTSVAFVLPHTTNIRFPDKVITSNRSSSNVRSHALSRSNVRMTPMPDADTLSALVNLSSSLMISETEPWVKPLSQVLGPFLNLFSFAMLCRVVISWYPKSNLNEFPYSLVVWPTEPLLRAIRGTIPPAFGVDITPIVWLAVFTFFNEILLGQQGLLTMKMKYGI